MVVVWLYVIVVVVVVVVVVVCCLVVVVFCLGKGKKEHQRFVCLFFWRGNLLFSKKKFANFFVFCFVFCLFFVFCFLFFLSAV